MRAEMDVTPAGSDQCVARHPGEPCPGLPHLFDTPTYSVVSGEDEMVVTCDECGRRASAPSVHDRAHHRKGSS